MITAYAWAAVVLLQLFALGYAFSAGRKDAMTVGGGGTVVLSIAIGAISIAGAYYMGSA